MFCASKVGVRVGDLISWFRASPLLYPLLHHQRSSPALLFDQSHRLNIWYAATASTRAARTASIASKRNGTIGDYGKLLLGVDSPYPIGQGVTGVLALR